MQKTAIIWILGVSTLALMCICIVQYQQIQELTAERASSKPAVKSTIAASGTGSVAQKAQAKEKQPTVAEKTNDLESIPQPKPHVAKAEAMPAENKSASVSSNEAPMAGLAKMMKSPGMRDMIRAQQKGQLDVSHASLLKYLQLPEADLETFKNILLDKQMSLMDVSLDMMNSTASPEEKKAAAERLKQTTDDYDARIEKLLGPDNYTVYKSFEETQPERTQVTMFKGSLSAEDQLTEEQEDSLIRAMHDQRTNFHYSVAEDGQKNIMDPDRFTPEHLAKLSADTAKLQELYLTKAAEILTPSQLDQFKTQQKQQQAMQEMAMKMAVNLFGQPSKEAPATPAEKP